MADAELRALERELAATGAPGARLALARHLERLGRRDDALVVLWPARRSPEVRPALAEHPAVTPGHPDGGAWDTAPARRAPRVRWRQRVADELIAFETTALLACPLGIACCPDRSRVVVLDPDDGRLLWDRGTPVGEGPRPLRAEGEQLVVSAPGGETLFDLGSGSRLGRRAAQATPPERGAAEWIVESPRVRVGLAAERLVLHDRTTGARTAIAERVYDLGAVTIARDVVLSFVSERAAGPGEAARSSLRAHDEAGRLLWALREPEELPVGLLTLAPLAGRLYALGQDGSVLCLGT